jgi:sporulation protein YabP
MRGEELHIKHLNLEQGELIIEGFLLEFAYSEERSSRLKDRGRSFFERLFK